MVHVPTFARKPLPADVTVGRHGSFDHEGDVAYLRLVRQLYPEWIQNPALRKQLQDSVYDTVVASGGRFLKKEKLTRRWRVVVKRQLIDQKIFDAFDYIRLNARNDAAEPTGVDQHDNRANHPMEDNEIERLGDINGGASAAADKENDDEEEEEEEDNDDKEEDDKEEEDNDGEEQKEDDDEKEKEEEEDDEDGKVDGGHNDRQEMAASEECRASKRQKTRQGWLATNEAQRLEIRQQLGNGDDDDVDKSERLDDDGRAAVGVTLVGGNQEFPWDETAMDEEATKGTIQETADFGLQDQHGEQIVAINEVACNGGDDDDDDDVEEDDEDDDDDDDDDVDDDDSQKTILISREYMEQQGWQIGAIEEDARNGGDDDGDVKEEDDDDVDDDDSQKTILITREYLEQQR